MKQLIPYVDPKRNALLSNRKILIFTITFTFIFTKWHSVQYILFPVCLLPKHVRIRISANGIFRQLYRDPESDVF